MPVKVLFIGGCGRSGSTLLGRLLNQIPGFCDVGELNQIWKRGVEKNLLCACGEPFSDCPFWGAIMEEAFNGIKHVDIAHVRHLKHAIDRIRRKPLILRPFLRNATYRENLREYAEIIESLVAAVAKVTSCRVLVDSSKSYEQGLVLSQAAKIDLHVVHIVRDARAVTFSWRRKKLIPGPDSKGFPMLRRSHINSARYWSNANSSVSSLAEVASTYIVVRYEDFVREPKAQLEQILETIGEDPSQAEFLGGETIELKSSHSPAGNPMRFESGQITIKPDIEWQRKLSPAGRLLVTFLTWPMLRKYGYLGST